MPRLAAIPRSDKVRREAEPRADTVRPLKYYAFLSYSHADAALADWLHDSLERFRTPSSLAGRLTANGVMPRRLTPIFRDRHELPASDNLAGGIRDALDSSRFLIVLCSPAAAASRWVNAEIDMFKRHRPDGCVLAAIIAGEPFASEVPGREAEECLPAALRQRYDRRGRPTPRRSEPLAADLRDAHDGKRLGLLKIIAGMLGVGLDELVQRETLRRQRRLAIVAAASLAGMVVTSTLAVVAIEARDSARDQRREAEGLVGFMLGDLRSKLEPLGRLDALDAVGSRALAYFQAQDKSSLSDEALAQRSRALTLMGEIANSRGDLDGALGRYNEAFVSTQELLRRSPDDPVRLFDHAQNVFWVGQIAWQRGQTPRAERAIREYRRLAERMIALDPTNEKYQLELKYANTSLGAILIDLRRYADAAAIFRESLSGAEKLTAAAPANADYQKGRLETLAWLSEALEKNGELEDALAQRERQISILDTLLGGPHSDVEYRRQAAVAHRAAGRLYAMRGEVEQALEQLNQSITLGEGLMRAEPDNAGWAGIVAGPYLELGEIELDAGQQAAAGTAARAGCDIANRLLARDSTQFEWRVTLRSACLNLRSRLALAQGATAEARSHANQLVEIARKEVGRGPTPDGLQVLASAELMSGLVAGAAGDSGAARSAYLAALRTWPREVSEAPLLMSRKVVLLEGLGRQADALKVAGRLDVMGYRHPTYLRDLRMVRQNGRTT
ncbi:MAG: TIR domain-containing protein [Sphingomicrobium sp.]